MPPLDLNLLRVLDAVVSEGSVSGAARRLHLSQSAVSHAIARLRHSVGDPLVVRSGNAMHPTAAGERIATEAREIMRIVRNRIEGEPFEPSTAHHRFVLAAPDAVADAVWFPLLDHLGRAAPYTELEICRLGPDTASSLVSGRLHAAVSVAGPVGGPMLRSTPLIELIGEPIAPTGHPLTRSPCDLTALAEWSHVAVRESPFDHLAHGILAAKGLRRRVSTVVPTTSLIPQAVSRTGHVGIAPRGAAGPGCAPVTLVDPLPAVRFDLHWSPAHEGDSALDWFVAAVVDAARGTSQRGKPDDGRPSLDDR